MVRDLIKFGLMHRGSLAIHGRGRLKLPREPTPQRPSKILGRKSSKRLRFHLMRVRRASQKTWKVARERRKKLMRRRAFGLRVSKVGNLFLGKMPRV